MARKQQKHPAAEVGTVQHRTGERHSTVRDAWGLKDYLLNFSVLQGILSFALGYASIGKIPLVLTVPLKRKGEAVTTRTGLSNCESNLKGFLVGVASMTDPAFLQMRLVEKIPTEQQRNCSTNRTQRRNFKAIRTPWQNNFVVSC